jgi:hypothetical protein
LTAPHSTNPARTAFGLDLLDGLNLAFSAGGVAASLAVASPAFAGSFALGAALEAVNFRALRAASAKLFSGELTGAGLWTVVLGMRLTILFVAMGIALVAGAHPLALLLGVSTVVPASLLGAWWLRPSVDPSAPIAPADDPAWDAYSVWRADVRPAPEDEDLA